MSKTSLRYELRAVVRELDDALGSLQKDADRMGIDVNSLRNANGDLAVAGLLAAKAQALAALAYMEGR